MDILTQCGDRKRFHEGQTAERICSQLSPIDDPERCIPLHRYLCESRPIAHIPHRDVGRLYSFSVEQQSLSPGVS